MSAPSTAATLATIYLLISLCAAVIVARIYLRLRIQKATLLPNDYLMIAAWCCAFANASFDIVFEVQGILKPTVDMSLADISGDPEKLVYILKISWFSSLPFYSTFYICKAVLLVVYFKLFPSFMIKRRIVLWLVTLYCGAAYIASMGMMLFVCYPIDRNWNISDPEKACNAPLVASIFQIAWVLHIIGSIFVFILPFLVVRKLQMKRRMMISVYGIFLLGIIDIAMSIARFFTIQFSTKTTFRAVTMIELWSALDAYIGLLIACLPSLSPYMRKNPAVPYDTSDAPNRKTWAFSRSGPRRRTHAELAEIDKMSLTMERTLEHGAPQRQTSAGVETERASNDDDNSSQTETEPSRNDDTETPILFTYPWNPAPPPRG